MNAQSSARSCSLQKHLRATTTAAAVETIKKFLKQIKTRRQESEESEAKLYSHSNSLANAPWILLCGQLQAGKTKNLLEPPIGGPPLHSK